ncbi:unannotated protein [freshwater metagenome]|uniref:Unannotated protein n=1 Tax=freshwater metagenome TaxID=449393 RepID=A0A6J6QQB5_9ZZZZ
MQVGALVPLGVEGGELLDLHHLGVAAEGDQLQRVAAEAALDEGVQREGGALHRHPPTVHGHRERRVDEQRDAGLGARLGLLHLDVADLQAYAVGGGAALGDGTQHGIGDRAGDVPRLGVAEGPLAGRAGALAGRTGLVHVALTLTARHPLGDVAQQGLAELAHRLGRELELAGRVPLEGAGVAQRALELLQGPGVDGGLVAELAGEGVEVEVVHPGAAVRLRELVGEGVEVGEILEDTGAVAEAEALLAVHPLGAAPVLPRSQRLQVAVELRERLHQLGAAEGLRGQRVELRALLGGHRVAHPLGGGGALGERVEQLVDISWALGEEVAVLVHELVELLGGVLTASVGVEERVEVLQHLVDRRAVLVGGALERLLHAGEALVEHLAPKQVLDLLVVLPRLAALPVVRRQLAHGGGGARRQAFELHLAQGAVAVVHLDVARQLLALLEQRAVEELADLLEGAVEVVLLQQLPTPLGHPAREVVEARAVLAATAQELPHRAIGRIARHHVLADRVERLGDVDRRRQRVAALVAAVAGRSARGVPVSHRRSRPRRTPC